MISLVSFTTFFSTHQALAYLALFLGSYFEILIGTGFFVYGEIFFLGGAMLAGAGALNIWLVYLVCVLGGILGDSSSFYIGWRWGNRFLKRFVKKKNRYLTTKNYARSKKLFEKQGYKAIFFARLLGPIAWVTPFLVGTMRMRYRLFLLYNIPGVIVGIGEFMIVGYFFGFTYTKMLAVLGEYTAAFAVLFILVLAVPILWKRYRAAGTPK